MRSRFVIILLVVAWLVAASIRIPNVSAARRSSPYWSTTIQSALQMCLRSRGRQYRIAVRGYFRPGPLSHGPPVISGGLFGSDRVPADAGRHVFANHGLLFGVSIVSPLSRKRTLIEAISRPHALLFVRGLLDCGYPPSLPALGPVAITGRLATRSVVA